MRHTKIVALIRVARVPSSRRLSFGGPMMVLGLLPAWVVTACIRHFRTCESSVLVCESLSSRPLRRFVFVLHPLRRPLLLLRGGDYELPATSTTKLRPRHLWNRQNCRNASYHRTSRTGEAIVLIGGMHWQTRVCRRLRGVRGLWHGERMPSPCYQYQS